MSDLIQGNESKNNRIIKLGQKKKKSTDLIKQKLQEKPILAFPDWTSNMISIYTQI